MPTRARSVPLMLTEILTQMHPGLGIVSHSMAAEQAFCELLRVWGTIS